MISSSKASKQTSVESTASASSKFAKLSIFQNKERSKFALLSSSSTIIFLSSSSFSPFDAFKSDTLFSSGKRRQVFPVSVEHSFFDCDVWTVVEPAHAVVNDFTT